MFVVYKRECLLTSTSIRTSTSVSPSTSVPPSTTPHNLSSTHTPNATMMPTIEPAENNHGLSAGTVAAIVLSIFAVIGAPVLIWYCTRRCRRRNYPSDNPIAYHPGRMDDDVEAISMDENLTTGTTVCCLFCLDGRASS